MLPYQHARIEGQRTELTGRYPVRMCVAIVKAILFREDNVKEVLPDIFALGDGELLPGIDDEAGEPAEELLGAIARQASARPLEFKAQELADTA